MEKKENPIVQNVNNINAQKDFSDLCATWLDADPKAKSIFLQRVGLENKSKDG